MKKITSFLVFLLLFCMIGCSPFLPGAGGPALCGTMWRPKKVPPYIHIEITSDGRLLGAVGKSRFFAPLKIDEGREGSMEIGSIAVSRGAESDPELEKRFFGMLGKVRFYQVEEHRLLLFDQERNPVARLVSPFPYGKFPEEKK